MYIGDVISPADNANVATLRELDGIPGVIYPLAMATSTLSEKSLSKPSLNQIEGQLGKQFTHCREMLFA